MVALLQWTDHDGTYSTIGVRLFRSLEGELIIATHADLYYSEVEDYDDGSCYDAMGRPIYKPSYDVMGCPDLTALQLAQEGASDSARMFDRGERKCELCEAEIKIRRQDFAVNLEVRRNLGDAEDGLVGAAWRRQ